MSKEAMKLALDALQKIYIAPEHEEYIRVWWPACEQAITALREALAEQPRAFGTLAQQEPVQNNPLDCGVYLGSGKDYAIKHHVSYGPAQQEPVAWKLVPREPTHEMLKAMDECSTEGYDERLYAGHAASVYMAAVDAAPTPPAQRKPLTDEEIILIVAECAASHQHTDIHFARAIERAHGIKELV